MYNDSHVLSVRNKMYQPKYSHKQVFSAVRSWHHDRRSSRGYEIPEKRLSDQFIAGLPASLRGRAQLLSCSFDETTKKMTRVESAAIANDERFFAVEETPQAKKPKKERPDIPHPGFVIIDGRSVKSELGKSCFRKDCDQNNGYDHFASGHACVRGGKVPDQPNAGDAGNGGGGGRE